MPNKEDNKQKALYDALTKDGYDLGTFESFSQNVNDEAKRKTLYETITKDNWDVGDYDSFSQNLVGSSQVNTAGDITQGSANPLEQPLHVEVPESIRSSYSQRTEMPTSNPYVLPQDFTSKTGPVSLNRLPDSGYQPTEEEVKQRIVKNKPGMFTNQTSSLMDKPLGDAASDVELFGGKQEARIDAANRYYKGNEFKERVKKETGAQVMDLLKQTDKDLNEIDKQIDAREGALRTSDWKPGMPSTRDDATLAGLRGQRAYLRTAENLLDDSRKIVEEAGKKDSPWYASLGRGVADKAFDVDSWTMGITDMAGSMNLNKVLEKADKEEELTPAEQRLLDAAVTNMAVNAYYSSDLSAAYKAGQVTGESLPFMLEMAINPISASGNTTAKILLKYGLKKMGKQIGKNIGKTIGAAAGMTATTGLPSVIGGGYDRMNGQVQFGLDNKGQLSYAGRKGTMGAAEAFGKSAASRFLENHSEMVFNAFKGMGDIVWRGVEKAIPGGVNSFIQKAADTGAGRMLREWGNNELVKEVAKRTQFHGIVGEFGEEVYNNLANVPLGEMSMEQVMDLDRNIDTFLGLAPTSVFFGLLGLGSLTAERINHRRKMDAAFGNMNEVQRKKFAELERMSKQNGNADIRTFIKETMADPSLTKEQKRQEIEYAYDIAVNNAYDEVVDEQAREQGESRTVAQEEGQAVYESGDAAAIRESVVREEVSRSRLEEVYPDVETIAKLMQADDAGRAEILDEMPEEVRDRAKIFLRDYDLHQSVEDAMNEAHVPEVEAAQSRVEEMTRHGRVTVIPLGRFADETHKFGVVVSGLDEAGNTTVNGNLVMVVPVEGVAAPDFSTFDVMKAEAIAIDPSVERQEMEPDSVVESMLGAYQADVDKLSQAPVSVGQTFTVVDARGESKNIEIQGKDAQGNWVVSVEGQKTPSVMPEENLLEMLSEAERASVAAEYDAEEQVKEDAKNAAQKEIMSDEFSPEVMALQPEPGEEIEVNGRRASVMGVTPDGVNVRYLSDGGMTVGSGAISMEDYYAHKQALFNSSRTKQASAQEDQAVVEEKPTQAAAPVKGDGSVDYVSYGRDNALKLLGEKYGEKMPHKVAVTAEAYRADLEKMQKKLDKAAEDYDNVPIGREAKAEAALQKVSQEYEALKREADFWSALDTEIKTAQEKPGEAVAEEILSIEDPLTGEEFAAQMLANGNIKLLRDSFVDETGFGNEEAKSYFGLFASADKGGVSIERAGERLMEADRENGTNFFDQSDPNAGRNAIIEVLGLAKTRGDLANFIKNNRAEQARREQEAENAAYEAWVEDNFHMSVEEFEAFEEVIARDLAERALTENEYNEFMSIFVDETSNKNLYGQQGIDSEGETGGEVLSGTQSLQTERAGRTEKESSEINGNIVGQNGTVSEGASGSELASRIEAARSEVNANPSEAQKEAGNYKMGHVRIDGYDITIENPKGSVRSGVDKGGKSWSIVMNNDYGYIRGTEAVDGDHIDVFLSDAPGSGRVFVVDQKNEDGTFDESKVMYGFNSMDEAREAYLSNYENGWENRIMAITEVSKEDFKKWIGSSRRKTKAFSEYKYVKQDSAKQAANPLAMRAGETGYQYAIRMAEEKRRIPLRSRASEWAKSLGVKVNFIEKKEDVKNKTVLAALERGQKVTGWFELGNGEVYFYMPNLDNSSEVDKTYIHEVVSHKGLPQLLGKERFDELCDKVWDMMPQSVKDEFINYPGVNGNTRIAADEYIAHLAEQESLSPEEKSVWDEIVKLVRDMLDKVLNNIVGKPEITTKDISELIKASYANLKSGANEGVVGRGTRFMVKKRKDQLKKAERFIEESLKGKRRNKVFTIELPQRVINRIKSVVGDVFDSHNLSANGLVHAKGNHGVNGEDIDEKSIPLRDEDFKLAPYIMIAPDKVERGSNSSDIRQSIRFTKYLSNGEAVVVEKEQKNSPVDMETITMWADLSSNVVDARLKRPRGTTSETVIISMDDAAKIRKDAEIAIEEDENRKAKSRLRVIEDKNGRKSLVGLHNISEEKLRKAIKKGGLANPSMAVIDMDKQAHVDYGDITLVAPSSLIDKKTGKNIGTYTADAWTPIYPQVEKQMSKAGAKEYSKALENVPSELRSKVRLYFNAYLEDGNTSDAMYYWFLKDVGKNPPSLSAESKEYTDTELNAIETISNVGSYYNLNEEKKKKVLELFIEKQGGKEAFEKNIADRIETMKTNLQRPGIKGFLKKKVEQKLKEIEEYGYDYDQVSDFYSGGQRAISNRGKIDEFRTFRNAHDVVNNEGLQDEFNKWLLKKEEQFGVEEYIFVGYNNNGDRKYIPNTLENASKTMKKEGRAGATGLHGFNHFVATLAPNAGSLAQINKKKGNLSTQEEYNAFREKWGDVYHELAQQLQPNATGYADYGYYRLEEMPTVKSPKEYVKKEYGIDLSDEFMQKYNDFVSAVKNDFPARYFETKFERPVYLNEFAAAVVPQGTSSDIVSALNEAGLPVEEYEKGNDESRMAAVDKVSSEIGGIRFRVSNRNQEIFVSNAQKVVEGIKQEKATPQQWLAMVEKNGGLKAGEDKWLGLSDWLKASDVKTLTKGEVLDFINQNKIVIEEVKYMDRDDRRRLRDEIPTEEYNELIDTVGLIDPMRLNYTTEGLENKQEIALTIPTIEPWNKNDEVHFGDAGEGRAIAWVRFGETTAPQADLENAAREADKALTYYQNELADKYLEDGGSGDPTEYLDMMNDEEVKHMRELSGAMFDAREKANTNQVRVLVIDEIQSKRHQEGREKGYRNVDAEKKLEAFKKQLQDKYPEGYSAPSVTEEQHENILRYYPNTAWLTDEERSEYIALQKAAGTKTGVPEAPFEKNWSELAMKRMLRYAAENGFDKVAWTTGAQQAERYSLGHVIDDIWHMNEKYHFNLNKDGYSIGSVRTNKEGVITWGNRIFEDHEGENIADFVGKELAMQMLSSKPKDKIQVNGLVGGEGMKGFYDKMLPSFVNKYVKKWGTKVQDIELPNVEEAGRIMHSVDVTDAMKESVMEGQTMFRISEKGKKVQAEVDKFTSKYNSKPVFVLDLEMTDEELNDLIPGLTHAELKYGVEELKMTGGYSPEMDNICIFVDNQDVEDIENTLFHENLHAMFHGSGIFKAFGDAAKGEYSILRPSIEKNYPESEWDEELFAYAFAGSMERGDFEKVDRLMPEEYKDEFNNKIKEFGYDKQQEIERRTSGRRNGSESREVRSERVGNEGLAEENSKQKQAKERAEKLKQLFGKVADMGLRGVLGDVEYDSLMRDIFNVLPKEVRSKVQADAQGYYDGNFVPAMSDYLNKKGNASVWDKIVGVVKESLRRAGFDLPLSESDVKYLIWRNRKPLNSYSIIEKAEDIHKQVTLKAGPYSEEFSDVRFREERPTIVREYDKMIDSSSFRFQEAFQDSMLSLKVLMEIIEKETGKKAKSFENAYTAENRLSSINKIDNEKYLELFFNPLMSEIKVLSDKVGQQAVEDYIYAKSGLERNEVLKQRDADKAYAESVEELDEKLRKGELTDDQYSALKTNAEIARSEAMAKEDDYAGLRGLLFNSKVRELDERLHRFEINDDEYDALFDKLKENADDIEKDFKGFAEKIVFDFEYKVGEDAVNSLWDKINAATNETLRKDYESGMLDKEAYEGTKNMMKHYIPLRGWSEKTAEDVYDYYHTSSPIQRNQKTAKGRHSQADNPIASIAQMAQNAIVRGNRNKMKQRLFNFVVNRPTALATFQEGWYVQNSASRSFELEYPEIEEGDTAEDIQRKMDEFEKRMEELAKEKKAFKGKLPFGSPYRIKAKQKNEHVVPVMINGREYGIYINGNPRAAQAVNGMTNPEASNMMSEMYEGVKRFYSAGLTSWNPDFLMANAVRDSIHSVTMTYLDKGPLAAAYYLKSIPSSLRTVAAEIFGRGTSDPVMHQYFEEFVNYGGETGYTAIHTLEDYKKEYEKVLKELSSLESAVRNVKGGFSALATWMEQANRIFEDVNRFNAYQSARRSGLGIEESVDAAKNITVNFNKKGALGTTKGLWGSLAVVMNKWILFFNPTVQGITQILRSRKMNPKRFNALLGTVFGSGLIVPFLNSMVVGMFGGDEEEYWLQNDYNRMNNLLLKNPFGSGYFKIPLPPTFREIYGMGDILYRLMTDRITPERAAVATLRQLQLLTGFLNLIPDEEPDLGKALIGLAPDVLAPLTDVILNQDFTGRKIAKVSDYNKHDPEYLRVYKGVSPFYVEVSKFINEMGGDDISRAPLYGTFINPAYMEHVITGYSGGIGKTLSNVSGLVVDAVSGEFNENFDLRKIPVVSRFYSVSDEATVKSAVNRKYRDYQSRYEKLKHDYKKYKTAVKGGELQFADELSQMESSGEKAFVDYFGRKQKLINKKLDRLNKNPDNKALEQEITDLKAEISLKCFELLK